jgi:predicted metalloprotease with PDZ domain
MCEFSSGAPTDAGEQQNCQAAVSIRGTAYDLVKLTSNHCKRLDARLGHVVYARPWAMSTKPIRRVSRQFFLRAAIVAAICFLSSNISAQGTDVRIRLMPDSNRVAIELDAAPASSWSFLDSYAGIVGLGRRIERFEAFDASGGEVSLTQTAPGQFRSTAPARHLRYEVDLKPVSRAADFSMISWLDKERGLLMPLDLLPVKSGPVRAGESLKIHFQMPASWAVQSSELKVSQGEFTIADVDRAVFALGNSLRVSQAEVAGLTLNLVTNGDWSFSDADVLQLGQQVLRAHRETFGSFPGTSATFILFPFPLAVGASQWSAETRGTTVTLIMGKLPSRVAALAQLSTPVTHEFFHLWIPNALALEGNYDWFYEGFTIYQAAQTAVKLGLLTFPEFLNSVARAYDASKSETNLSLIEASSRRFTGGSNSVYAKSQVVAFLYDLRLRSMSHNKRSLADVYRRLIKSVDARRTGGPTRQDGSQTVASVLTEEIGSEGFVASFVRTPVSVNLASELAPFGLIAETGGFRTQISISEKLTKRQRDLLRDLGYNAITHAAR